MSASDLDQSIIRILNDQGRTVGTGFVITHRLAVTCAHVVTAAGSDRGHSLSIQFLSGGEPLSAKVCTAGWSPREQDDVAFLELTPLPDGVVPVVLGSADHCIGHRYTSLGFARLAGYDTRRPNDIINGVVEARNKRPMLELKGTEVDQGLSGAPVLDLDTDRVVGMISEFKPTDRADFAWATTADTLAHLCPDVRLWGSYGPADLATYLGYVIAQHEELLLPGGQHRVRLEQVYVSLRADAMNATERHSEYTHLHQQITAALPMVDDTPIDPYTHQTVIWRTIVRAPQMLMLEARGRERLFGERDQRQRSLAEVVQQHQAVVVLGDPGSGKTTLSRWLALQFARTLQDGLERVVVRADSVTPGEENAQPLDMDVARLPVYVRIADYANARWSAGKDTRLPLDRFLQQAGMVAGYADLPEKLTSEQIGAIVGDYAERGQALLLLDGLDEVIDPDQRLNVMREVGSLIEPAAESTTSANRVLLTSRIVGYQFQPLTDLPHYTVEPMERPAIEAYCRAWMRARSSANQDAVALSEALIRAIFDELHPGVRELARNPLLLTILAEVFWSRSDASLPTRRVALFDQAVDAVYNQRKEAWEQAGVSKPADMKAILGAVADTIHTSASGGFVEEGTVSGTLRQQGLSDSQAEEMLHQSRELSGFLVARGQGVYGFLHRSLQEYFVGQHLVREPEQAAGNISDHLLDPIWREPILLAVGIVSQPDYHGGSQQRQPELLAAMLQAPDPAGAALPRRELLLAAACAECERIVPAAQQHVVQSAHRLLDLYAQREGRGRSETLRQRIRQAFTTLCTVSDALIFASGPICIFLCDPDFERRFAAVEIIRETEWYTPAVARALQRAWVSYPGPAASLLMALEEAHKRLGADYPTNDMLLRQELEDDPALWETISTHEGWQQVIRGLVLSFAAPLRIESINRDTPLIDHILSALQQSAAHDALESLQEQLLPLAQKPGSVLARDAALVLSWLGDDRWVAACVGHARDDHSQLLPIVAGLTRNLDLDRDLTRVLTRDLDRDRDLARDLARDLDFDLDRDLALTRDRDLARNLARDLDLAHDLARDLARDLDFDLDFDLDRDLDRDLDLARARDLVRNLARARALVRALARARDLVRNLARDQFTALQSHLAAAQQRLRGDPEISSHLADAEKTLQHLQQWLQDHPFVPVLRVLLSTIEQQEWASSSDVPPEMLGTSEQTELQISREHMPALLEHLQSGEDAQRVRASRLLREERDTSSLEPALLEDIAGYVHNRELSHYTHTNLYWALGDWKHDRPDWVAAWIDRANADEQEQAVRTLPFYICTATADVVTTMLDALPDAMPRVKAALLAALANQARGKSLSEEHAGSWQQLLAVLDTETEPQQRVAIIETLEQWRHDEYRIGSALLERLRTETTSNVVAALYTTLAHLASRKQALQHEVQEMLQAALPHPTAAAALARLLVALTPDAETLLAQLTEHVPDPPRCLMALLDAGIGTDGYIWDEKYHTTLAIAARLHIEQHPESMKRLYRRLQRAINQDSSSFEWRQMLVTLTACMEVMPRTVEEQCGEGLESLLVKIITFADWVERRYALTALSYLREVTPAVVPALLAGCQDVEIVQKDAIEAAQRFHIITGDEQALLAELAQALTGESLSTAYTVAHVLGALGTSPVGATAGLREQIITHLVAALDHPNSQREVILYGEREKDDVSKGKLEETLFEVLLKVAEL